MRIEDTEDDGCWPALTNFKPLTFFSEGSVANSFLFRRAYNFRLSKRWQNHLEGVSRQSHRILRPLASQDVLDFDLVYQVLKAGYRYAPVTANQAKQAQEAKIESLFWNVDPNQSDYVYKTETFLAWPNARHRTSRQTIRALLRNHRVEIRMLTLGVRGEVLACLQTWRDARKLSLDVGDDSEECLEAIELATTNVLAGYCVYVDDRLVSFLIADLSIDKMIVALFMKADLSVHGAADYCLQAVCEHNLGKEWINTCQDLGLPGLRSKKLALCPDRIVEKVELFL